MGDLPTPVAGRTRPQHQADHNLIAQDHNLFDFDTAPSPGDSWTWDGSKWVPGPGGGGGLTVIPFDSGGHYYEGELIASSPFTIPGFPNGGTIIDLDTFTDGVVSGFFEQCIGDSGKKGLRALQSVLVDTYLEIEPTPGQTYGTLSPWLRFEDAGASHWNTAGCGWFTQAVIDDGDYVDFGPQQITLGAGTELYLGVQTRGASADITLDYADMELQVVGVFA